MLPFRVQKHLIWLILAPSLYPPGPLLGQDPSTVGAAIAAACRGIPDPERSAVIAGTVTDARTGVALPGALVSITWEEEDPRRLEAEADLNGFFAFCDVPGGREVGVSATLRVTGDPILLETEAGMLHMVPLTLPLSDPTSDGTLMGRVIDEETREPVEGASVFLWDEEIRAATVTNKWGYFSLGAHAWGIYTLRVNHVAYGTTEASVRIAGDMTESVELALSQKPIELEGIVVKAQSRLRAWDMDGLVRRMDAGWGWFITRDRMERTPAWRLQDFLRDVPGVRLVHNRLSTTMVVRGRSCAPAVFVDGMPWVFELDFALQQFMADQMEAVEVYRSGMEIPGEFRTQSDPCAVIAIWTRR